MAAKRVTTVVRPMATVAPPRVKLNQDTNAVEIRKPALRIVAMARSFFPRRVMTVTKMATMAVLLHAKLKEDMTARENRASVPSSAATRCA